MMTRLFFISLNIFFFFFVLVSGRNPKPKPRSFVLPVIKDSATGLHYTTLTIGKPELAVNLTLDVRGPVTWIDDHSGYNSTTYRPIRCGATRCKQKTKEQCMYCFGTLGPSCGNKDQCFDRFDSPFEYSSSTPTGLVDDNVMLTYSSSHDGFSTGHTSSQVATKLPLSCSFDYAILDMLPVGSFGILGLGNDSFSMVNTLVSTYKIPFKVALCLPSSNISSQVGSVYIGGGPYALPPDVIDASGLLLSTTSLIRIAEKREYGTIDDNSAEESYYIHLESIEVNYKKLSLNQSLLTSGTKISTTTPYTILQTSIYKALVKAFAKTAKQVRRVKPFRHCYTSQSFGGKTETPLIRLGMEGGAMWEIHVTNSLVKVNEDVMCLAFLDGGENPKTSIEIGAHQLEDVLVEFDLETSKFSVSTSLLRLKTSCRRV